MTTWFNYTYGVGIQLNIDCTFNVDGVSYSVYCLFRSFMLFTLGVSGAVLGKALGGSSHAHKCRTTPLILPLAQLARAYIYYLLYLLLYLLFM